ncbi:hypothetical protein [Burkholderia cepacia]|uniref:Uncharacterized protein n=1 Tax=Burkholderia cepacia GG4 TaxID=1009846 RepID=A0A9W3JZD6_BURCE|nr:hypothetical protein [Burkholderia cepacia]AFQ47420.1 hypothetical protein GEM_0973 [Burkholderia cepacia GG4]
MLTPIVRMALGARRGLSLAVAPSAADAGSSGSVTTRDVTVAAPSARLADTSSPAQVVVIAPDARVNTISQPTVFNEQDIAARVSAGPAVPLAFASGGAQAVRGSGASAARIDSMRRLPLYCAERRPREAAARRGAVLAGWCDRRAAGRRVAGRRWRNAESGCRSPCVALASMIVTRSFCGAWRLNRAGHDAGGTRLGGDGIVALAACNDLTASRYVRARTHPSVRQG